LGVEDMADLDALRRDIQRRTGRWVRPWYEGRAALVETLAVERTVMLWISLTAVATAAFGSAGIALLRLAERRYELGVMPAVGASPGSLARGALAESLIASLLGSLV